MPGWNKLRWQTRNQTIDGEKIRRARRRKLLGSRGAASKVRHIDPAGYEMPVAHERLNAPPIKLKRIMVSIADEKNRLKEDAAANFLKRKLKTSHNPT
jgi:hypothetical protein